MKIQDKTIWITGAGSGIGRALAIESVKRGAKCILSDINPESLNETCALLPEEKIIHQARIDVGNRQELKDFIQHCISSHGPVDIVINNAGTSLQPEDVTNTPYEDFEWLFEINMWGVLIGSKEFLPHLLTRPEGYIVNISSVFGIIGFRKQAAYCMTKFAVRGLTETLRVELKDTKVKTLSVHPGGIDTNIVVNLKWKSGSNTDKEEQAMKFKEVAKTTPEKAANTILNAIKRNKNRVRIGIDARFIDYAARLSPGKAATWIANQYEEDLV